METILETRHLRVEYRAQSSRDAKKVAVQDLNLKVQAGEVFGFLGPNGAGKTTSVRIALGLLHPSSGKVAVILGMLIATLKVTNFNYYPFVYLGLIAVVGAVLRLASCSLTLEKVVLSSKG